MSVLTLLDDIEPQAPRWSRSTGNRSLLRLIQKAQDKLFDCDAHALRWVGTDNNGFPPYLITTAGQERYEITAANLSNVSSITKSIGGTEYAVRARRVIKVFVDATNIDYGKRFVGEPYQYQFMNPYTTAITRIEVSDVPVRSYPALENTNAYLDFTEDPGASTGQYFVSFTWEPPRLSSEYIPLAVPEEYEEAIEDYVVGTIQKQDSGRISERLTNFNRYWIPRFRQEMGLHASASNKETTPRFC